MTGNGLDWTVLGVKWKLKLLHVSYDFLPMFMYLVYQNYCLQPHLSYNLDGLPFQSNIRYFRYYIVVEATERFTRRD
jgi:hypothetical protein